MESHEYHKGVYVQESWFCGQIISRFSAWKNDLPKIRMSFGNNNYRTMHTF